MSHKKYSTELKLEIVQRYLEETIGLSALAKLYCVWPGDIQKWRDAYIEHGIEGLCVHNGTYSGDFKVGVVEYMYDTGASIRKTAAHFNIPSFQSVSKWKMIYEVQGKEALFNENRGRAKGMGKKGVRKANSNPPTDNKELLKEIERLRMENEYLKKLNALVREREKSEKSIK